MFRAYCCIAVIVGCAALPAGAAPMVWHVENLTFAGGGSATGQFTYDRPLNTYSNIQIDVVGPTGWENLSGRYDSIPAPFAGQVDQWTLYTIPTGGGQGYLRMLMNSQMTDAGGTIPLIATALFITGGGGGGFNMNSAGYITTVPEPTALAALMLPALALLQRRRR